MKITKHILAACILTGMAACDTDKEIAVFNEDSGAIKINAVIDAATSFTYTQPVIPSFGRIAWRRSRAAFSV